MTRTNFGRTPPAALICAVLQDGNRILFLKQADNQGTQRIGLPCIEIQTGQDAVQKLAEAFFKQTGIDGHIQHVLFQGTHNAGSRKKKRNIPALAFKVEAKNTAAKPSAEFSGYAWLSLDAAPAHKLLRTSEWLKSAKKTASKREKNKQVSST